ncbi:MAG TPA: transketolase C-terminal domain-containing protein, partial [Dehalococcoidia bacterium]|nr:transketolase C-terminal domain-containing protein [Dehalococcoidia bacterium]
GSGAEHSIAGLETTYAMFHGIKVVCPHKVYDAKGLMAAALRDGAPVAYMNYSSEASADIPDEPYVVPIGKAQILKEGSDITIATWGPASIQVEQALPLLEKEGIKAEYFDPRTLKPFDDETLAKSVTKTKRLLVVSHGHFTNDFSAHILASAAENVPGAKFRRITFPDTVSIAAPATVEWMTPNAPKIVDAAKKLIG